ncbi:MAG: sugar ABC transporter permease [Sphaerochaeta sp.]|nr:sugar ABC transporter permease [Sphaerochaeta sp.]
MQRNSAFRRNFFYYILITPAVLLMVWLTVYPVLDVLVLSFYDYNYITDVRKFAGLKNFQQILSSELFRDSFVNTLIFSLAATLIEVGLGLALALAFDGEFFGKRHFMTVVIFPMMLSTMVVSAVWKTLYHQDIGLLNSILKQLSLKPVGWLIDPSRALSSIIIVDIWQWTPFTFIMLQASLQSIPREIFEAAQIDGARYPQIVFRITIPILLGQILLIAMLRTIDTFKLFGKVYALTQGGPGNATETLSTFIYREGFSYFNLGRAATASLLTLVIVSLISLFYIKKLVQEEGPNG